jgi:hypothetical protein
MYIEQSGSGKMLKQFVEALPADAEVKALGDEVIAFAQQWPMPGYEVTELKYKTLQT